MPMNFAAYRQQLFSAHPELREHVEWVEKRMNRCESDLERLFVDIVAIHLQDFAISYDGETRSEKEPVADLQQQVSIAGYRCDFVFTLRRRGMTQSRRVAVECDGHSFHDRTKEQASYDRRRDRRLIAVGVPTLRYTYSDLTTDPDGSVRDLYGTLRALALEIDR